MHKNTHYMISALPTGLCSDQSKIQSSKFLCVLTSRSIVLDTQIFALSNLKCESSILMFAENYALNTKSSLHESTSMPRFFLILLFGTVHIRYVIKLYEDHP